MDKPEILTTYSLPISGGSFTSQCALLGALYDTKKKLNNNRFTSSKQYLPDICLAASGGNIASYLLLAADGSGEGMMRILRTLHSDLFIRNWFPDYMSFLPTGILGIFKGSLYRPGYGPGFLFNRYFCLKTIQNVEIWTGTHNVTTNKAEFFCNKSVENAHIQQSFFENEMELYDVMKLRYLSDEPDTINMLAKASMASASIPYIVKSQQIGDHLYSDGGVMYSSPTLPLINELYRLVKGHKYEKEIQMNSEGEIKVTQKILPPRRLRHFYFSPYDTYSKEIVLVSRTINGPLAQILHANLLQDKAAAITNLQRIYGVESSQITHEHYIDADNDTLYEVLKKLEQYDHYVMDLYPKGLSKIPLKGFSTKNIEDAINYVRKNYAIQVWYYAE